MTAPPDAVPTTARDALGTAQDAYRDLAAQESAAWSRVDAGEVVDPDELNALHTRVEVARRRLDALDRAAVAEQEADDAARWAQVEADTLAAYQRSVATFRQRLDLARAAVADLADAGTAVNAVVYDYKTRPDQPIERLQERATYPTAAGVSLIGAAVGDAVMTAAADGLDRAGSDWAGLRDQAAFIRSEMIIPDPGAPEPDHDQPEEAPTDATV